MDFNFTVETAEGLLGLVLGLINTTIAVLVFARSPSNEQDKAALSKKAACLTSYCVG